jgi:hypothetical protein
MNIDLSSVRLQREVSGIRLVNGYKVRNSSLNIGNIEMVGVGATKCENGLVF